MKSRLVMAAFLSLGLLLVGCDKSPPGPEQQTAEKLAADKERAFIVEGVASSSGPSTAAVPKNQYGSANNLPPRSVCTTDLQCAGNNYCIGSPPSCQPRFDVGHACSRLADCAGSLSCDAGRCTSPSVPLAAALKPSIRKSLTPLVKVNPVYPREAIRSGIEKGEVVAQLFIDDKGLVTDVKIVEADPPGVFDNEVMQALSQWTFQAEGEKFLAEIELNFVLK